MVAAPPGGGYLTETPGDPSPVVGPMKTSWCGFLLLLAAALSAAAQPPAPATVRSELGVMIPMRDGVKLAADVWMPEAPGRYPVLLVRTPYEKTGFKLYEWAAYFASRGYVFAVQDTRGRGDSEGTFDPFFGDDTVLGRTMPLYRDWLTHSTTGPYWDRLRFTPKDFAAIDIPTLTVTGWFDGDQPGALFYWRGLMANGPHRDRHFLIVGPWRHPETFRGGSTQVGDAKFSPDSIVDTKATHLAFFDACLKGQSSGFNSPRARIYVTGANVWRTFDQYPPAVATPPPLYLASRGRLNWQPASHSK